MNSYWLQERVVEVRLNTQHGALSVAYRGVLFVHCGFIFSVVFYIPAILLVLGMHVFP